MNGQNWEISEHHRHRAYAQCHQREWQMSDTPVILAVIWEGEGEERERQMDEVIMDIRIV